MRVPTGRFPSGKRLISDRFPSGSLSTLGTAEGVGSVSDRGAHRKVHRLLDHSSSGLRVIKKKKEKKKAGQSVSVTEEEEEGWSASECDLGAEIGVDRDFLLAILKCTAILVASF